MIPALRKAFNESFTEARYQAFLADLDRDHPGSIAFRVAETPIFIPGTFWKKMLEACETIVDIMLAPGFKSKSAAAIPPGDQVPGPESPCQCIAFDFGVCETGADRLEPRLIELQGFPTLFGFQAHYYDTLNKHFPTPPGFSPYFSGLNKESYLATFRDMLLGGHETENVILLEINPHEQKTRVDFYDTQDYTGIQPVNLTDLSGEGRELYYVNEKTGAKTRVKRIYNRVIFDDLHAHKGKLGAHVDLQASWDVEWVPHPNWFYRLSKYTLPSIRHPAVPETFFLDELKTIPPDLDNYVLKPLFSFAGQGVIIDLQPADLEKIAEPHNWILQRKVNYAACIETPAAPAKAEIRIMYLWPAGAARPIPATSLTRLSKGKMIGVRYNQDQDWVGGCGALFEQ